jgi:hypothetical protein
MQIPDGFIYNGHIFTFTEDREDDNVKRFHEVRKPDGSVVALHWSPYSNPTQQAFELYVDMGCPEYPDTMEINGKPFGHGRWTHERLLAKAVGQLLDAVSG